jgi:PAS domain S-box-containing protein
VIHQPAGRVTIAAVIQKTEGIAALLFGLFADAPVGLVLLDTDLRYVLVNDTLADLNGVPASAHVGRTVDEVVPELAPQLLPVLSGVLKGTPVVNLEINERLASRPGARATLESFYPLRDSDGRVAGIGGVVVDITRRRDAERIRDDAQRHARDSERFLRELLAEERAVLHEVVARAPAGIVLLWGPDARVRLANDRFREIALLDDDPTGRPFQEVLPDLWPIAGPLLEKVRSTGAFLAREDFKIPARDPLREGAFAGHRYMTFTLAPVRSGEGEQAGILLVVMDTTAQVRRRALLEEELRAERRIVTTLQRALLPRVLPDIPGAAIAARYEAAGARFDVGGDFYDAFELPSGEWFVVVGDVCGKGPEAAALTAMVRYTLRAEATRATSPGGLLTLLNAEMLRREIDMTSIDGIARFTTVACAWAQPDPEGLAVRIACAGQPDPLILRAHGDIERVPPGGPPCGAFPDVTYPDHDAVLGPGEAVVFYTDGVLDAGAPRRQLTIPDLVSALSGPRPGPAEAIADTVADIAAEYGANDARDDIAVLVLAAL